MRLVKCSHVFKLFICWITEVHETVELNSLSFSLIRLLGLFKQKHWWLKSNKSCFNWFVNCITFLYDYFFMYHYCSTVTMVLTAIPLNHPALTTCYRWDLQRPNTNLMKKTNTSVFPYFNVARTLSPLRMLPVRASVKVEQHSKRWCHFLLHSD